MIDRHNYSGTTKIIMNIGGLEREECQQSIVKILNNLHGIRSFSFEVVNEMSVLVVTLDIQLIPEITTMLCKENLAIYEISQLKD